MGIPERPSMTRDDSGTLRVGESRVLVDLVIHAFQDGATPEAIYQRFPAASLADIYGVISYYLNHQSDMDKYLADREKAATEIRKQIEMRQGDQVGLRERLMARQKLPS